MEIRLTKDKIALIEEIDADLALLKWHAVHIGSGKNIIWYAERSTRHENGKRYSIGMHRVILMRMLGRPLYKGEQADHINHNGLDNRHVNLRVATRQENIRNSRVSGAIKYSKFKGVTWNIEMMKWQAYICLNGRNKIIGLFRKEEDAARAYDKKAKECYLEFCCLNFPD